MGRSRRPRTRKLFVELLEAREVLTFTPLSAVSVGNAPRSVAVADFNHDGILDLAAANGESDTISIRLGDGQGAFTGSTNVSVGDGPFAVAAGDFNRDGDLDLAVT